MDFRFTEEEEAFRKEVRDFLLESLPPDWPRGFDRMHKEALEEIHQIGLGIQRKLAAKGWIGISWPKEYGGQGSSLMKQIILEEELDYWIVPGYDLYAVPLAGPLILQFGTEEQKRRFISRITRGEERWCIGMSEPNAGSDLAALQTRAVEEDDCFVLNGQKIWTSGAHYADWCIVYARTDPSVPKHRGLSVFLVNLETPGITMRRITQMTGLPVFNEVFYDNVRIPKENLLGGKNQGWSVTLAALETERTLGVAMLNNLRRDLGQLVQYCKETYVHGQPIAKDPLIRNRLADVAIHFEVARTLGYKVNWLATNKMPLIAIANSMRVLSSICGQRLAYLGMQILGLHGQLSANSKWARLAGKMSYHYLYSVGMAIEGGTTEVARSAIAIMGLGLPREPRR